MLLNLPLIAVVIAAILIVVGRVRRLTWVAVAGYVMLVIAALLFLFRSRL